LAEKQAGKPETGRKAEPPGIRLVYISPLKALNNDIHRNLQLPLAAIGRKADELGLEFPTIEVAVHEENGERPPHW
jgi:ATP-dependent Lhr-like helicase